MVRHIVMWKFKEDAQAEMMEFIQGLRSLNGVIPQILDMEVGINELESKEFDAVLVSTFASMEDLETYKNDPRHVAVSQLCKSIRTQRVAVDYQV